MLQWQSCMTLMVASKLKIFKVIDIENYRKISPWVRSVPVSSSNHRECVGFSPVKILHPVKQL